MQVETLGFIVSAVQSKFRQFVKMTYPVLAKLMVMLKKDTNVDDDNDLSDACLTTIRCIAENCPLEMRDYENELLKTCMDLMKYDPEYTYTEGADDDDDGGWGDEEYGDEGGFGGAQEAVIDSSWKVRRGAIKIIAEVANVHVDKQLDIV